MITLLILNRFSLDYTACFRYCWEDIDVGYFWDLKGVKKKWYAVNFPLKEPYCLPLMSGHPSKQPLHLCILSGHFRRGLTVVLWGWVQSYLTTAIYMQNYFCVRIQFFILTYFFIPGLSLRFQVAG